MTKPILTRTQIVDIAKCYDGKTTTINELLEKYRHTGVKRHNIVAAARAAGYRRAKPRIRWNAEKDDYLLKNYGKIPLSEIFAHFGLEEGDTSISNRLKRIGHSTRCNTDFTIHDLESLTKIDHRLWQRFITDCWLHSYEEFGRSDQVHSRRVTLDNLKKFLSEHPEIFNYRAAEKYAKAVLELDKLPDPPAFMMVTCRSDSWQDRITPHRVGKAIHHGSIQLEEREHRYSLESCDVRGGTDFWAQIYESPICPRCGCKVSRFSEKAMFSDTDPGNSETLNAIASKLRLSWQDGKFFNADGDEVTERELLQYVFSTKRNPGKAFQTFRRLLEAGMSLAPKHPVPPERVLPNILKYSLKIGQEASFQEFLGHGNVGVYWPPGQGKMYFLGMVFSRIAGEHALFVHTRTIREQWIEFFQSHGNVKVVAVKTPYHYRVDIFDNDGILRSQVRIFSYLTREAFDDGRFSVVGFDEAQFLPGNHASRLSMLKSEFRVGLSATPFREDGRADMIQMMTGLSLGEDWQEFKDSGAIPDVPVHVLLVEDLEQKYRALHRIVKKRKTIIFSDGINEGKRIQHELGVPFIYHDTKRRLDVLKEHQVIAMSRVGDCGIDTQDLEEVIEFNFHHGSRAQSLQRMGRLLHSRKPFRHTVMMTFDEFSLYHKRLSALEMKGFPITMEVYREQITRGRPPAPKSVDVWTQLLGIKPAEKKPPKKAAAEVRTEAFQRIERRSARASAVVDMAVGRRGVA